MLQEISYIVDTRYINAHPPYWIVRQCTLVYVTTYYHDVQTYDDRLVYSAVTSASRRESAAGVAQVLSEWDVDIVWLAPAGFITATRGEAFIKSAKSSARNPPSIVKVEKLFELSGRAEGSVFVVLYPVSWGQWVLSPCLAIWFHFVLILACFMNSFERHAAYTWKRVRNVSNPGFWESVYQSYFSAHSLPVSPNSTASLTACMITAYLFSKGTMLLKSKKMRLVHEEYFILKWLCFLFHYFFC